MKNRISEFIILTFLGVFLLSTFFVGMTVADAQIPTEAAPGTGVGPTFTQLTVLGNLLGRSIRITGELPIIQFSESDGSKKFAGFVYAPSNGVNNGQFRLIADHDGNEIAETLFTVDISTGNFGIGLVDPPPPGENNKFVVVGDTFLNGNAKVNKNLSFYGDFLPNGTTCLRGDTIEKTVDSSWGCTPLPSGSGGVSKTEVKTLIDDSIDSKVLEGATIDTAIDNVINTSIEEGNAIDTAISVAISSIGGHWSKVLDDAGNETNDIEYTAGNVEIGVVGDYEKGLRVNGPLSTVNGIYFHQLLYPATFIEPALVQFYRIGQGTSPYAEEIVDLLSDAYGLANMMYAGDPTASYSIKNHASSIVKSNKDNNASAPLLDFSNARIIKWFFNEIILQTLNVEEYIYNPATFYDFKDNTTRELPVKVNDDLQVIGDITVTENVRVSGTLKADEVGSFYTIETPEFPVNAGSTSKETGSSCTSSMYALPIGCNVIPLKFSTSEYIESIAANSAIDELTAYLNDSGQCVVNVKNICTSNCTYSGFFGIQYPKYAYKIQTQCFDPSL